MKIANLAKTNYPFYLIKCGLAAASIVGVGLLSGCGEDGSSRAVQQEAKISGTVSNNNGTIESGKIQVKDNTGSSVATIQFSGGKYSVTVPASAAYPIVITAFPPDTAVNHEPVKAVVTSPIADRMDVSSVTTTVVDGALALGGLTVENIAKASGGAIGMRQSQGVSAAAGGSGGGPGNSGGGAGQGGHGGHNMDDMRKAAGGSEGESK